MNLLSDPFLEPLARTTLALSISAIAVGLLWRTLAPASLRLERLAWLSVLVQGWLVAQVSLAIPWLPAPVVEADPAVASATPPFDRSPAADSIASHRPGSPLPSATDAAMPPGPLLEGPRERADPAVGSQWVRSLPLLAWCTGIAVALLRWVTNYLAFVRRLPDASPIPRDWAAEWDRLLAAEKLTGQLRLRVTPDTGPLLCRLWSGCEVVVPAWLWTRLSPAQREALLRHELAHFRRGDLWKSLAARLLVLPHWFNPLAWRAVRRFEECAEWACDEIAAGPSLATAADYSKALLALGTCRDNAPLLTHSARRGPISVRIRRLLASTPSQDSPMKKFLMLLLPLVLVALHLLRVELVAQDPPQGSADGSKAGQPAAEKRGSLSGRLVDVDGKPIPLARVTLFRYAAGKSRWGRRVATGDSTQSDKEGRYRFTNLADGIYLTSIERRGFARDFGGRVIDSREGKTAVEETVVLRPPATPVIEVTDEEGRPLAGARVRGLFQRGVNGHSRYYQIALTDLKIEIPASDEAGRIRFPEMPVGEILEVMIDHPTKASVRIDELKVAPGATARATMRPGVTVTLRISGSDAAERVTRADIDLDRLEHRHPSVRAHEEIEFGRNGIARLTVEPGDYFFLRLENEDFLLTPSSTEFFDLATGYEQHAYRIEPGRNDDISFELRRKVWAKGKVIDAATGKPIPDLYVHGKIPLRSPRRTNAPETGQWLFSGYAQRTDENGEYSMSFAPGPARVSFSGKTLISETEHVEFVVASDGSTKIPDLRVRALPKFVGTVRKPDGSPAPRVVVRIRGKYVEGQEVLTDEAGRFETQPKYVPIDPQSHQREFAQQIVAFDPFSPLAARAAVRLDQPAEITLTLEPHEPDWPLQGFDYGTDDWIRTSAALAEAAEKSGVSLRGRSAPELDPIELLNTNGRAIRLADLKGKFVLLHFWFEGCGPCHEDMPSVQLVHELFKDRGVAVVSVHNNFRTPEQVREHVKKLGLPFPIAIDNPDGRIVTRYQAHGIAEGFPSHVLIDPEGNVLIDRGNETYERSLRSHKIEIIRRYLLENKR